MNCYVVVFVRSISDVEIHKFDRQRDALEQVMEYLRDNFDSEVENAYLEYVGDNITNDWDFEPESLNEWLMNNIDNCDLDAHGIFIDWD